MYHRQILGIIRAAQIRTLQSSHTIRHNRCAYIRIRAGRPARGRSGGIRNAHPVYPSGFQATVRASLDGGSDGGGPFLSVCERGGAAVFLGDGGVPDRVKVGGGAVEGDGDLVAAEGKVLVVEGLVYVTNEVDEEHEGLVNVGGAEGGAADTGGLSIRCQRRFLRKRIQSKLGMLT